MTDLSAIADRLSSLTMGRTSGLRLREGMLTLVLDVTGLSNDVREAMEREVRHAVQDAPGVDDVRIAMTQEKTALRIIAVGSGKGGVGKSTLSANLAVALKRLGHRVGLVDADIYGPSQPRLMGSEGEKPEAQDKKMFPIQSRWGVPMLSMGHLVKPGQAIAWRGPMAGNALSQLVDARWDGIDTLIVDLPPGTGDVQLSMIQKHKPAGAVIVSTPQDLALIDAARAVSLFEQAGVPLIGLVENMAGYACPSCGEVSDPFGSGGAEKAAGEMGMPFLGRIPLAMGIRTASDAGEPPAAGDGAEAEAFRAIAEQVAAWLGKGR
ncbi:Mrp/NBP35 family ATP-binding protein [Sphingobium phenoxybenzoativorans]|uniref:Mrp/NBP35 family ATP-binding protein n=1 Tax=Sphingobium phenoxybenzoativorans TaxID=1592790 RepID=UPI000872C225|nr:Mrp/NBP35 family ATP-binding protein [Sphingobium phenoxybenzoativorans]